MENHSVQLIVGIEAVLRCLRNETKTSRLNITAFGSVLDDSKWNGVD